MGSAAQKPVGHDLARIMFREIEAEARRSIKATGNIDPVSLLDIVDTHQACAGREEIRLYMTAYLARCLLGYIPDYKVWEPFP